MENFGLYKFRIIRDKDKNAWFYQITGDGSIVLRESKEFFQYESIARFAAIGHISLLEQGKG